MSLPGGSKREGSKEDGAGCQRGHGEISVNWQEFLSTYGYWAILVGTLIEGETILIIGGLMAYQGYLSLPWVMLSGFGGTLLGDQLYFYLGRIYGLRLLRRRPSWQKQIGKVERLLDRFQNYLILLFRFLYGLRTVTPFVIGLSRISPRKFLLLNALGAVVWSFLVGAAGYLFGTLLETILGDLKKFERIIFLLMALAGAIVWGIYLYFRKRRKNSLPE